MLNRITMTGRLVADPELRRTQSGVSVTSFRIANDRDYGKGEEKETDFFDVVAWRCKRYFPEIWQRLKSQTAKRRIYR